MCKDENGYLRADVRERLISLISGLSYSVKLQSPEVSVATRLKEERTSTVTQRARTETGVWTLDLSGICFMWDGQITALCFPSLSTRVSYAFCPKDRLAQG